MHKPLFFAGIENLGFKSSPGRGDIVGSAFSVTSDGEFLNRVIPQTTQLAIGELEFNSLCSGRPVFFTRADDLRFGSDADAVRALTSWLTLVIMFAQYLWLLKDNAASVEMGYLVWTNQEGQVVTTRNYIGTSTFSDAVGVQTTTVLSKDEFRKARELFQEHFIGRVKAKVQRVTRLERAMFFINVARSAAHAPVKIANFCTAMEALFSNDTTELTHRLSERVAWFLGADAVERKAIFLRVKRAYAIRSKVVHGSPDWGKDVAQASDTARFLDNTLRQIFGILYARPELFRVFSDAQGHAEPKHEEFLTSLIFDARGP